MKDSRAESLDEYFSEYDSEAVDLLKKLLKYSDRLSLDETLSHPFLS